MSDNNAVHSSMRIPKIKNYNAAPQQITAEQLMREVPAYRTEEYRPPSQVHIMDQDELQDYKYRQRRDFEEKLRMQRHHMGTWIKYAEWEASINEFLRSRSVFERAMQIDYQHVTLWLKYAEMEMRNKNVDHARNVWDRACKHMPRVDQFWYKYAHMEEMLGNLDKVREIFEDWLTWEPKENAWDTYVSFEERNGAELEKTRSILQRYTEVFPSTAAYMKAAKFEEKNKLFSNARKVYERALGELGQEALDENFFIQFVRFEIKQKEHERAKVLFKYSMEKLPQDKQKRLQNVFLDFQKQYGTREDMEDLVLQKRRAYLEEQILVDNFNYDNWFDYTRLEEQANHSDLTRIRDVYERAISNQPLASDKLHWRRYIYLWLNYAVFEETIAHESEKTRDIYMRALSLVPHDKFTFSKLWILYTQYLLRIKDLTSARKIMGQAIGKCPRKKLFKFYIDLEMQLLEFDRCRKIFERQIQVFSFMTDSWVSYATFESNLGELERCRQIFEIAIQQEELDMPEGVWKAYIDFEISQKHYENARSLYQRLLIITKHVKVWISYAKFEQDNVKSYELANAIYEKAYQYFKSEEPELKEERILIIESWAALEGWKHGLQSSQAKSVSAKLPKRVKKRREQEEGWEEYFDYIFPDDQEESRNIKILEMAHKWKNDE